MFIFIILGLMSGGIYVGYLLRGKRLHFIHKIMLPLICALLFLLGVEVGFNDAIIKNFRNIGIEAAALAAAAVLGSALMAWALWKVVNARNQTKDNDEP